MVKLEPRTKFLVVKCEKCKNEQIIFNRPSSEVKCLVCGETLSKSTGGFGDMKANVLKEAE